MKLIEQIETDLKQAMLARNEVKTSTLRSLKSALTYASVDDKAKGGDGTLGDEQVLRVFTKESKKRQDSADAFEKGGATDRAEKELAEKQIIDGYLPAQISDGELAQLIDQAIVDIGASGPSEMGPVIGRVKTEVGGQADGARIAGMVRERLTGK